MPFILGSDVLQCTVINWREAKMNIETEEVTFIRNCGKVTVCAMSVMKSRRTRQKTKGRVRDRISEILDVLKLVRREQAVTPREKKATEQELQLMTQFPYKYTNLFDPFFRAGELKERPIYLQFKTVPTKLGPQTSRMKPPRKELEIVREWITKSLKDGVIEVSESAWRSCIFPVEKPPKKLPNGFLKSSGG